jgi:hypothetical protein
MVWVPEDEASEGTARGRRVGCPFSLGILTGMLA